MRGMAYEEDGLHLFGPPRTFTACKAVILGGTVDSRLSDSEEKIAKPNVRWGHVSFHQLQRVSDETMGSVNFLDEVMEEGEVCRASDQALCWRRPLMRNCRRSCVR